MSTFGKAVWLHSMPKNKEECEKVVNRTADAGFDLLVACVQFMDGKVEYPSDIAVRKEGFESFDPLAEVCRLTEKRGLKLHPWLCVFTEGKDAPLVKKDPSVLCLDKDGKTPTAHGNSKFPWVCPRRPEVREYEMSLYLEIMDRYPVAGVHLDYIRYNGRDVCFCKTCREAFRKEFGEPIEHMVGNPREYPVYVPALDWRTEPVTQFVRELHKETAARDMELSAAVFHSWPIPRNSQGQDWRKWADERIVEFLFPMNYTAPPRNFESWALLHRQIVKPPVQLWEGFFRFPWATTEQMMNFLRLSKEVGAEGAVAFQYTALTDEDCAALAKF